MKNWLKEQLKLNPQNLKAIGIGFLWGVGISFVLGLIGIQNPAIGVFVWIFASYKYQKKFNKQRQELRELNELEMDKIMKKQLPGTRLGQTKYSRLLYGALARRGIESITEYPDGHKTIDIAIPSARLYIEVDGVQHLNNPEQIITDFKRDYYSEREGFYTLHIHNDDLKNHLNSIADAIAEVVKNAS